VHTPGYADVVAVPAVIGFACAGVASGHDAVLRLPPGHTRLIDPASPLTVIATLEPGEGNQLDGLKVTVTGDPVSGTKMDPLWTTGKIVCAWATTPLISRPDSNSTGIKRRVFIVPSLRFSAFLVGPDPRMSPSPSVTGYRLIGMSLDTMPFL
jgi:hypothetical protein